MTDELTLERLVTNLKGEHGLSDASISFLEDKGFKENEFERLYTALNLPDQTFAERREEENWPDTIIRKGDAAEITTGRYERLTPGFWDISSEQALVRGRMKFAVEYVIALADEVGGLENYPDFIPRAFTNDEKDKLRSIYEDFQTKDYEAAKIIERKTRHDIVAANTWVTIRAQQLGLDDNLMRKAIHFARTSADVNTNVTGELYMKGIGKYASSLSGLVGDLKGLAEKHENVTCIARTHGQDGQLTTLGHIYANLAEQIKLHAKPLLQEEMFTFDGKIAGAIGTDVDMVAAFPDHDFTDMYKNIVEEKFGLNYVEFGNDQDCTNASLASALDTMVNVGMVVKKGAMDTWIYASRGLLKKKTKKGESGSSAMPQKANPFLAEGAEALVSMYSGEVNAIKEMTIAYREQGDLRRSITKREAFHPIMLATIAVERLRSELKNYDPNIIEIEREVYSAGPKVVSSAINTYLRANGMPDAYDRVKELVMKPNVRAETVTEYVDDMVSSTTIPASVGEKVQGMLQSVMDTEDNLVWLYNQDGIVESRLIKLSRANSNQSRLGLVGKAITNSQIMAERAEETIGLLERYAV